MGKRRDNKDLETSIEKMCIGGQNNFSDCFYNFLDLALSYFCNNMDDRQIQLRKRVEEDEGFKKAYKDALEAYGDLAENYHDPLGDMFMTRISHGNCGQFFTPESLSELCANILNIGDGETLNDPTCGSGRMLLMALKIAREVHGNEPILYGNDISITCSKMTLLNFLVNSVDGEVTCGDALRLDWDNFKFYKIDKMRNLSTGAVFSTYWQYTTADVDKVSEKRKKWFLWVAEHGWIKYRRFTSHYKGTKAMDGEGRLVDIGESYGGTESLPNEVQARQMVEEQVVDPLPTEIKVEENGQLSIF